MKPLWYTASIIIAIALTLLLIDKTDLSKNDILPIIQNVNFYFIISFIFLTYILIWLSALKWKLTSSDIFKHEPQPFSFFLRYTTLGAMLSTFTPSHLSSTLSRSVAMRLHHNIPIIKGSASSIFEQAFDVYIFLLCGLASIFYLIGHHSFFIWLVSIIIFLILGLILIVLSKKLLHKNKRLPTNKLGQFFNWLIEKKNILNKLYVISIARFFILIIHNALILQIINSGIEFYHIAIASPLVQLSILLSITPGSIGIVEWSWTGLLNFMNIELNESGIYALTLRVTSFIAVTMVFIIVFTKKMLFKN